MIREKKYLVLKITDLEDALSLLNCSKTVDYFEDILETVEEVRALRGRGMLKCVVIEDDWPEFEKVWAMLEERVDNE
jgi:hypothetical protein